jgi:hypothetical protein
MLFTHPITGLCKRCLASAIVCSALTTRLLYYHILVIVIISSHPNELVQSTVNQTIHVGLCIAVITKALALRSNCKCIARRAVDCTRAGKVKVLRIPNSCAQSLSSGVINDPAGGEESPADKFIPHLTPCTVHPLWGRRFCGASFVFYSTLFVYGVEFICY